MMALPTPTVEPLVGVRRRGGLEARRRPRCVGDAGLRSPADRGRPMLVPGTRFAQGPLRDPAPRPDRV